MTGITRNGVPVRFWTGQSFQIASPADMASTARAAENSPKRVRNRKPGFAAGRKTLRCQSSTPRVIHRHLEPVAVFRDRLDPSVRVFA